MENEHRREGVQVHWMVFSCVCFENIVSDKKQVRTPSCIHIHSVWGWLQWCIVRLFQWIRAKFSIWSTIRPLIMSLIQFFWTLDNEAVVCSWMTNANNYFACTRVVWGRSYVCVCQQIIYIWNSLCKLKHTPDHLQHCRIHNTHRTTWTTFRGCLCVFKVLIAYILETKKKISTQHNRKCFWSNCGLHDIYCR